MSEKRRRYFYYIITDIRGKEVPYIGTYHWGDRVKAYAARRR